MASQHERDKILRGYLTDGGGERLSSMPRRGRKRQVVLEHVVQSFEPGRRYTEIEVNRTLRPVWPDVAALRRYLVDHGLLDRSDGLYWRCGGPVLVEPDA